MAKLEIIPKIIPTVYNEYNHMIKKTAINQRIYSL